MASLANTIVSLYNRISSNTGPRIVSLRRKQDEMASAALRTRQSHSFYFLDLQSEIRHRIYTFLFAGNVVQVCSYNKDKTSDTFSIDERCQILLTNKHIYKEARMFYYWHSDWKFVKVSSLDYIAWGDGGLSKLRLVQKVIITNQDVVAVFTDYLSFFPNLKVMVIDFPSKLSLRTRLVEGEDIETARKVRNGNWWSARIAPFLLVASKRQFSIKVGVQTRYEDDPGKEEMILIDVDRLAVTRNFRPVDPPPAYGFLYMPSSEDEDTELSMVHRGDIADALFSPPGVPRRSKRRLRYPPDAE